MIGAALPPGVTIDEDEHEEEQQNATMTDQPNQDGNDDANNDDEDDDDNDAAAQNVTRNPISDEQLEILELKLAANPFVYESHVELVQAFRKCTNKFDKLRQARRAMLAIYAFTEGIVLFFFSNSFIFLLLL